MTRSRNIYLKAIINESVDEVAEKDFLLVNACLNNCRDRIQYLCSVKLTSVTSQ